MRNGELVVMSKYKVFIGGSKHMEEDDLRNFEKRVDEFLIKRNQRNYSNCQFFYTAQKMADIMCRETKGTLLIGTRPFDNSWGFTVHSAGITVIWDHNKEQL
jgi:hypothetical protein